MDPQTVALARHVLKDELHDLKERADYWAKACRQVQAERDAWRDEALRGLLEHERPAFEAAIAARLEKEA